MLIKKVWCIVQIFELYKFDNWFVDCVDIFAISNSGEFVYPHLVVLYATFWSWLRHWYVIVSHGMCAIIACIKNKIPLCTKSQHSQENTRPQLLFLIKNVNLTAAPTIVCSSALLFKLN